MPLITDPDDLTYVVSNVPSITAMITVAVSGQTIYLTEVGNLSGGGVAVQTLYSKLKEIWLSENVVYPFPMEAIYDESFKFINGWKPANDYTRKLLRNAGWAETHVTGYIQREYANITTLGSFSASAQAYYSNQTDIATDFQYTGPVNEAVQIYGDISSGNFNRRNNLILYLRVPGKTYDSYDLLTSQNLNSLTYKKYGVPLSNTNDIKINVNDTTIDSTTPYSNMSVVYYSSAQVTSGGSGLPDVLAGGQYAFGVVIDASGGTAQEVYNWFQRQLRKNTDINANGEILIGKLADDALQYIGENLYTRSTINPEGGGTGVFIKNLHSSSINTVFFTDNTGNIRNYPFVAYDSLAFNDILTNDISARYYMYFTSSYGTSGALLVNDNDGNPITGMISGNSSIPFSFAYDTNTQGGRTAGTDANITVVAIGKENAKFTKTTATLTRSTGQIINVVGVRELGYIVP